MQTSLTSDSDIQPRVLIRGASLIARQLGHADTDTFRASILALLEQEQPLTVKQLRMLEDVKKSDLGGRALEELHKIRFRGFNKKREEHIKTIGEQLISAATEYSGEPVKTTQVIQSILARGAIVPDEPTFITADALWNDIIEKQKTAVRQECLRNFGNAVLQGTTEIVYAFPDGKALHFDPEHILLGIIGQDGKTILGSQTIRGLTPTRKPSHIFSQNENNYGASMYAVCLDLDGRESILEFSADDMNWGTPYGMWSRIHPNDISPLPSRYLDVIPAENILVTREVKDYAGAPVFVAHIRQSQGDDLILSSSFSRHAPYTGIGPLSLSDIAGDLIITRDNGAYGMSAGIKIVSVLTGQEMELRDKEGIMNFTEEGVLISYNSRTKLEFEGVTPHGKNVSKKIGGWLGTKEVYLSKLVEVWREIALLEAGKR